MVLREDLHALVFGRKKSKKERETKEQEEAKQRKRNQGKKLGRRSILWGGDDGS